MYRLVSLILIKFQDDLILISREFDFISFQENFWFNFISRFLIWFSREFSCDFEFTQNLINGHIKKLNHGMLLIGFISCLTYRKSSIFLCSYTAHDYYRKSQNILRCIFLYLLIFVRPFYFVLKNKNWLIIIFAKQRQQIIMMVFSLLIDKIAKITKKCTFTNLRYPKFA